MCFEVSEDFKKWFNKNLNFNKEEHPIHYIIVKAWSWLAFNDQQKIIDAIQDALEFEIEEWKTKFENEQRRADELFDQLEQLRLKESLIELDYSQLNNDNKPDFPRSFLHTYPIETARL